MKKLFLTMMMIAALIALPFTAMADTATINSGGSAYATDDSSSNSGWWIFTGNDDAGSFAEGMVSGNVVTSASGWFGTYTTSTVEGFQEAAASSYAIDIPFFGTSFTGASASTYGEVDTFGKAWGIDFTNDTVVSTVTVEGHVSQGNDALEGYGNNFVSGGNMSNADFVASDIDTANSYLMGIIPAMDWNSISGGANVDGSTFVTIDKYGSNRSLYATTETSSSVYQNGGSFDSSSVTGNGGVSGSIVKNLTSAGGIATFNYSGNYAGSGNAMIDAQIYSGGNFSTMSVTSTSSTMGF